MQSPLFDTHYAALFGERWSKLKAALQHDQPKALLVSSWADLPSYRLDRASLFVAAEVEVPPDGLWLDLCSAPGGKALAVISRLMGGCTSHLNELSDARRARLKAVLHDHLPPEVMSSIHVFGRDGSKWGVHSPDTYDAVLVDAPCSGERHLLQRSEQLKGWKPSISKRLQVRQHALLCAALDAVKPGGVVVYSTCALSPLENDGVIQKLAKSRKGQWVIAPVSDEVKAFSEQTEFGYLFTPDRTFENGITGLGPMYLSKIRRKS